MESLENFAYQKLSALDRKSLKRSLQETSRLPKSRVIRNGKELISFSCNDYLGLSQHPRIIEAIQKAVTIHGTGGGASRLVTGNYPLYNDLEKRLAELKGTEDACVFGSGYLANLGIIPSLVGEKDLILIDELSHSCMFSGTVLSKSKVLFFHHNDVGHLEALLKKNRDKHPRALILTDGVFSMDGDLAPIPELSSLSLRYDTWLMTDDAHGIGVVGKGRGSSFAFNSVSKVPLQMGTLSKAVGSYGGYLCASKSVIDLIKTRARTLIYSTSLAPANIVASIEALKIIESNPELIQKPLDHAKSFSKALGLKNPSSAIVPLILEDTERTLEASKILEDSGYLVTAIRPPTVPKGTSRLRFTFSATHSKKDVSSLANIVNKKIIGV
tara:strand:+ start:39111 stop:40265 length:1155 start_codon:yes stop_codon:yes gene_type:complete